MSQFYLCRFNTMRHLAPVALTTISVANDRFIKVRIRGWVKDGIDDDTLMLSELPRVVTLEEGLAELAKVAALPG